MPPVRLATHRGETLSNSFNYEERINKALQDLRDGIYGSIREAAKMTGVS
jgi:hypothetical protein